MMVHETLATNPSVQAAVVNSGVVDMSAGEAPRPDQKNGQVDQQGGSQL
jgi:hypothetical protein